MTGISTSPYVRLRRIPGDLRLYITQDGATDDGYLAEATIEINQTGTPDLRVTTTDTDPTLYDDATPDTTRIRADRILLQDVCDLGRYLANDERDTGRADHRFREFLNVLDQLRRHLSEAVPPPCGHEDVIETPEFGEVTTRGICVWCPTPLLMLNDEWIPA